MLSYATLRKRFLKLLRLSCPRRNDTLVVVTLNNSQSYLLLKLVLDVERFFGAKVVNLHIGSRRIPEMEELSRSCSSRIQVARQPSTVTELKLIVYETYRSMPEALYVLPLAAEEIYCYVLGEVMLGNVTGLILERNARVAYPLATTSLTEIEKLVPVSGQEAEFLNPLCRKLIGELKERVEPHALSWLYIRAFVQQCTTHV
jgi:hypothetical protein